MTEPQALYTQDGEYFIPTDAALGPWRPDGLHGGAVNALLARSLEREGFVIARITLDLLRRVPNQPLRIVVNEESGSPRIRRQNAELWAGDTLVATAQALRMPQREVDIPAAAIPEKEWDINAVELPAEISARVKEHTVKRVGYTSFASHAVAIRYAEGSFGKPGPATAWIKMFLPVVEGETLSPVQRAAAAADYASGGNGALPYNEWSFMNADLTVQFIRPPVGEWIAVATRPLSQRTGIGMGDALLHDAEGPFGRSTQSLLIEPASR